MNCCCVSCGLSCRQTPNDERLAYPSRMEIYQWNQKRTQTSPIARSILFSLRSYVCVRVSATQTGIFGEFWTETCVLIFPVATNLHCDEISHFQFIPNCRRCMYNDPPIRLNVETYFSKAHFLLSKTKIELKTAANSQINSMKLRRTYSSAAIFSKYFTRKKFNVVRFCRNCSSTLSLSQYAVPCALSTSFATREQHRRSHECAVPFCFVRAHHTHYHTHRSVSVAFSIPLAFCAILSVCVCVLRLRAMLPRLTNARACALTHTHNDRNVKSNMLPIHGSASSKRIQLPFDCPNGWFSWRIESVGDCWTSHCGWKETRRKIQKGHIHTIVVTTPKNRSVEKFSVENPVPLSPKSRLIVNYWVQKNETKRKERFDGDIKRKWKSENSIWKTICLAICWANWTTGELFARIFFLFAARSVAKSKWKKKTTAGFCIAFCIGTRNAYKSYKFGDTNTISELWIVADTVSICRPCVRVFFAPASVCTRKN